MAKLYGRECSAEDLTRFAGRRDQFAGVRLVILADGTERGIRALEFRTGTGLFFTVLVDRAMDIADCDYRGAPIGWHSPAGFRHPGLGEYEGEGGLGWLRSFSGLMMTCGLDHILFMEDEAVDYAYAPRKTASHSIHGRIATIPARLTGYGERWEGDRCVLYAEGEIVQAAVFAEHLVLLRRIEAEVGTSRIRIVDRVVNRGYHPTPHMFLYHINVCHPIVDEGARYVAPVEDVVWAGHEDNYEAQGVGYRRLGAPGERFHEQVWEHRMAADGQGRTPVAIVNDAFDGGRGLGFMVETDARAFPCHYEWQNLAAGHYALGLEPSTNHVLGKSFARERGELIMLGHGEERLYDTTFAILDGADEIEAVERRIAGLARQPDEDYPRPSGGFADLSPSRTAPR